MAEIGNPFWQLNDLLQKAPDSVVAKLTPELEAFCRRVEFGRMIGAPEDSVRGQALRMLERVRTAAVEVTTVDSSHAGATPEDSVGTGDSVTPES